MMTYTWWRALSWCKRTVFYSSPLLMLRIADFSLSDVWNLSNFRHNYPSLFVNESVSALDVVLNA